MTAPGKPKRATPKPRNAVAKALADPLFGRRCVPSRKGGKAPIGGGRRGEQEAR